MCVCERERECCVVQVNADIKKYQVGSDGVPNLFEVDKTSVGRNISTKAVGSSRRQDLTGEVSHTGHRGLETMSDCVSPLSQQYKHPEGSDWERRALYHGYEELLKETHDMTFSIPETSYSFGQDVTLQVEMSNKARQHVVKGSILCEAVDYTGRVSVATPTA